MPTRLNLCKAHCIPWRGMAVALLMLAIGAVPVLAQRPLRPSGLPAGALPPADLPEPTYEGNIREISSSEMVLQLDQAADVVKLKYSNKTEVYKDSKKVKVSALSVGDRVFLIGNVDSYGFLSAKKITFERAANAQETARIQAPLPQPPPPGQASETSSLSDDSGRPTLRRRDTSSSDSSSANSTNSSGGSSGNSNSSDSRPTLQRRNQTPADSSSSSSDDSNSAGSSNSSSTDSSSSGSATP